VEVGKAFKRKDFVRRARSPMMVLGIALIVIGGAIWIQAATIRGIETKSSGHIENAYSWEAGILLYSVLLTGIGLTVGAYLSRAEDKKRALSRFWNWLASLTESTGVYATVMLTAWFGILSILIFLFQRLGIRVTGLMLIAFTGAFFLVLAMEVRAVRNTHAYLMYLAGCSKNKKRQGDLRISDRIRHLRWFLRGVKRIGNLYTDHHFQDLVLKGLKPHPKDPPPSRMLDQIIAAIELRVVDDAAKKPRDEIHSAFEDELKGDLFNVGILKISSLSDFLVDHYAGVSSDIKDRVRLAFQKRQRVSTETVDLIKLLAPAVVAILSVVTPVIPFIKQLLA